MEKVSINGIDTFEEIVDGVRYRQVPEWCNYWVGENGRVYNKKLGWMLKVVLSYGYPQVFFHQDGKRSTGQKVHRWVAKLFIPNPENKREVNHILGIKHDNKVESLEWVTPTENSRHAWRLGLNQQFPHQRILSSERGKLRIGGKNSNAKKVINVITKEVYGSILEAAESIGMKKFTLNAMLLGRNSNRTNFRYLSSI